MKVDRMIVRIWRSIVPCGSDWLMLIIRGKTGEFESSFGAKIESLTSLRLQIKFVWNCAVDISLFGYLFQQNFLCTMADNSKQEKKIKKPSSYVLKRSKIFVFPYANCAGIGRHLVHVHVTLIGLSLSDGKEEEINLNKVTARIKKLGYELSDFVDTVRLPLRVNQWTIH